MPDAVGVDDPTQAQDVQGQPEIFIPDQGKDEIEESIGPSCVDPMHHVLIPLKDCLHHRPNV